MIGKTYPRDRMFMTFAAGNAQSEVHGEFDLGTGLNGAPVIRSIKTGKSWSVDWQELLDMAISAGVAEQEASDAA